MDLTFSRVLGGCLLFPFSSSINFLHISLAPAAVGSEVVNNASHFSPAFEKTGLAWPWTTGMEQTDVTRFEFQAMYIHRTRKQK